MKLSLRRLLERRSSPIKHSIPGFDPVYYLDRNSDVRSSGCDPLRHYLDHGWKEGRDPSAGFSTSGYLAANPDVDAAGENPLVHFLNSGLAEGRRGYFEEALSPALQPSQDTEPTMAPGVIPIIEPEQRLSSSLMAPSKNSLPWPEIGHVKLHK